MTGNPGMCGNRHQFIGNGKYCSECGHGPNDDCHIHLETEEKFLDRITELPFYEFILQIKERRKLLKEIREVRC
jgi:hypothetical protein